MSSGCHAALTEPETVHPPLAGGGGCGTCHAQEEPGRHAFTFPVGGTELCYVCHGALDEGANLHAPLGDEKNGCTMCHDPHSSSGAHLLKSESTADNCLTCHAAVGKGETFHQFAAQAECATCHDPHASDASRLLRSEAPGLCYNCHANLQPDAGEEGSVHGPMAVGCTVCHDPHRKRAGKGLAASGEGFCITCHRSFEPKLKATEERHGRLLEGESCLRCHDPHTAAHRALLRRTERRLCLGCHDAAVERENDATLSSVGAELQDRPHRHGPLANERCTGCHQPHANDRYRFLTGDYPPDFYQPYRPEAYDFCFRCHDRSLVAEKETTEATRFRDGERNLHYLHVHLAKKGRTCRACHAPHAADNPRLVRDSVPFGEWSLPVGWRATERGGTCQSGCHRQKTYTRARPPGSKPEGKSAGR
ncbi:MAG: cytochrome c3 family protein [Planctomycetota bacterium]